MELKTLIDVVKKRPDFDRAGMILAHNGVVRGTSRDGRKVSGLRVQVDHGRLAAILEKNRSGAGILDIQVWINGVRVRDWRDTANHAADGAADGMIAIQLHGGNRYIPGGFWRWRNIGVKELP